MGFNGLSSKNAANFLLYIVLTMIGIKCLGYTLGAKILTKSRR